jgi:hypothetical protein
MLVRVAPVFFELPMRVASGMHYRYAIAPSGGVYRKKNLVGRS